MISEKIYEQYILEALQEILAVDSPTGFSKAINEKLVEMLKKLGYDAEVTNKRAVRVSVKGKSSKKKLAISAHVDTLGAMVKSISGNGELRFTRLGGPTLATFDGEYCKIYADGGKVYTGTFLSDSPSCHVYKDAGTKERNEDTMYVRIDEEVGSKADVEKLGIRVGSLLAIDTKTTITDSGYIKSRFLDDKAGSACLLAVLYAMKRENLIPAYDVDFYFTNYEEVGHGAATIAKDADELLAVDMGCVGDGLGCTEKTVSICAKDSGGPYNYDVVGALIDAAKRAGAEYAVDVYPHYGSDVEATLRAGADIRHGLIGAGVYASHGYERSHKDGVLNTLRVLKGYLF